MFYWLYVYNAIAACKSAPAVGIVNAAIRENTHDAWNYDQADEHMGKFEAGSILAKIAAIPSKNANGGALCKASEEHSLRGSKPYVKIVTSYDAAEEVLPELYYIAQKADLVLYDPQNNKTFFRNDLFNENLITMKKRVSLLLHAIRETMKPLRSIEKLEERHGKRDALVSYVVTINKDAGRSFLERTDEFYRMLRNNLSVGETLYCEDQCFTIWRNWYSITFCFEGYKKHADKKGYVNNGKAQVAPLNRMGCVMAFKIAKGYQGRYEDDVFERMRVEELVRAYPNPADRFVKSVNISKALEKETFDIRYSTCGYYGSEILFHLVNNGNFSSDMYDCSVLKIEEESASFILPFVNDVYPYIYERYNLTENHIPHEMMTDIVKRLKKAQNAILHDIFSPTLKPYIRRFNPFVLSKGTIDEAKIRENEIQFLYEHRYEIAHLYDIFIRWVEAQLVTDDSMFNIQGP